MMRALLMAMAVGSAKMFQPYSDDAYTQQMAQIDHKLEVLNKLR